MQTTTRNDMKTRPGKPLAVIALRAANKFQARRSEGRPFTACVSEISWCPPRRSYHKAVKRFAEVYAAYQEYLAPAQHSAPVYEVGSSESAPHCGCLSDELMDSTSAIRSGFDDDTVETCGYFGWLQGY